MEEMKQDRIPPIENLPAGTLSITRVRNCVVTKSGLVVTYKGVAPACLYDRLSKRLKLEMSAVGIGSVLRNPMTRMTFPGEIFQIFNVWGLGYHHFLTEVAPKLFLFEDLIRKGRFLIPRNTPGFISDFLNGFDFKEYEMYDGNVFVKSLNIISNPNTGHYSYDHLRPLRERAIELFGRTGRGRKLYVSRRNARARKVVNEEEIRDPLEKAGFEFVELDEIPFAKQVEMFSECSDLISIHGAGLTNMLFMPAGGRIVELYPRGFTAKDFFNPCYKRLSSVLSHHHTYVLSDRIDNGAAYDLRNDDIVLELSALMRAVERMSD